MYRVPHRSVRTDRRGVSPVIGVVMMVAITVILTGIIAAFVLGFGAQTTAPPQASLDLSMNDSSSVTLAHVGGEPVDLTDVYLRGDIERAGSLAGELEDEQVRLIGGEQITVELDSAPEAGDTLLVLWDTGDDAATLAEFTWPRV